MAQGDERRTPTLSISLTPELLAAVEARVESGLYTSASEVLREALRLFLQVEQARLVQLARTVPERDAMGDRLATTFDFFDFGRAIQAHKLRSAEPLLSEDEAHQRAQAAARALECDHVIRPSPERLKRLQIDHGPR